MIYWITLAHSRAHTHTHKEMSVCNPPRSTELYIHGNSFNSRCVIHKQDSICGFTALYTQPLKQQGQSTSTEAPWHSSFRDSLWKQVQGQRGWKSQWINAWQWKCTWRWKSVGMDVYIPDLWHSKMHTHTTIYTPKIKQSYSSFACRADGILPTAAAASQHGRRSQTGLVKKSRSFCIEIPRSLRGIQKLRVVSGGLFVRPKKIRKTAKIKGFIRMALCHHRGQQLFTLSIMEPLNLDLNIHKFKYQIVPYWRIPIFFNLSPISWTLMEQEN